MINQATLNQWRHVAPWETDDNVEQTSFCRGSSSRSPTTNCLATSWFFVAVLAFTNSGWTGRGATAKTLTTCVGVQEVSDKSSTRFAK